MTLMDNRDNKNQVKVLIKNKDYIIFLYLYYRIEFLFALLKIFKYIFRFK